MNKYNKITEKERFLIEYWIRQGLSMRAIAAKIDRPPKTVYQEIRRNEGCLRYNPELAHLKRNRSNRKGYSKIDDNPVLACYIRKKLECKWAPGVIAGRWHKKNQDMKISTESIYTCVYKQQDNLYKLLPLQKKKRGRKSQRKQLSMIPNRVSVHLRPENINERVYMGHMEADLLFQKSNGSTNVLTLIERKSRVVLYTKCESKRSEEVINKLKKRLELSKYPAESCTFDNGTEFTRHTELGMKTYFCDKGSPWQKGSVEHANGIFRRHIDYRLDIHQISQDMLDQVADTINRTPRKILNFLTPYETAEQLYREKLESVTLNF